MGHPVPPCTQSHRVPCTHQRSVGLCLPLVHITPEQLGDGTHWPEHPWMRPEPQGWGLAHRLATAPRAGCTPWCQPATPLPRSKACSSVTATLTGHPAYPAGPDAGERIRAEAAILFGHSLDTGPQETAHLKRHPEFVSYGDATGRVLSCPHAPFVLTFPVCPVKQIFWQGYRVTYYPCIAISNPPIYLLFIYFSIIHLFTGNLEAIKKALLVILL